MQSGCTHVFSGVQRCVTQQVHLVISAVSLVGINGTISATGVLNTVELCLLLSKRADHCNCITGSW